MIELNHSEVRSLAQEMVFSILRHLPGKEVRAYPIPRGGIPVAYLAQSLSKDIKIVEDPAEANIFIDDLVDSGATMRRWQARFPDVPWFTLLNKQTDAWFQKEWVSFPWEKNGTEEVQEHVTRLIEYVGENPNRSGIKETPARFIKALDSYTEGYKQNSMDVLKLFEDGAENYDQMVLVRDIPFYSLCEHHLAPFFGTVSIGYIPRNRILGLSKFSRLTDVFARRLQVQERLTNQIADALVEGLQPAGVGVVIKARHLCMESRGVRQQGHHTVTSALRGAMKEDATARSEFLNLASK
jgi:GTP cyclohydrolase I